MTTRSRRFVALLLCSSLALTACSSSSARDEFAQLTGATDDELDCIEDLADPDDANPFGVLPDCLEIDRLREVASNLVGASMDVAREAGEFDEIEEIAIENGLDLEAYQACIADSVAMLEDRELRTAFAAPTSEQLGERLAAPFIQRCVGVAQNAPTLGIAATDVARLVSGAIGRIDARLQNVTVVESGGLRVHLVGDQGSPFAAVAESPNDANALNAQVTLTETRLADAALEALGGEFGFDPPTATNLTVTGSRELDNGLLACVIDDGVVRVTIRPGPDPCPS